MKRKVAILLFPSVEVLDFAGPFEVFAVTDELRDRGAFDVYTVADSPATVRANNGLVVVPDYALETAPAAEILVVPGGYGTRLLVQNERALEWVRTQAGQAEIVMSVCTGAIVLGRLGLLDGLQATTHHACFDLLREHAPKAMLQPGARFTDNGKILTAAGISAGIDCSLHVVERLLGKGAAETTARYMEYRRA